MSKVPTRLWIESEECVANFGLHHGEGSSVMCHQSGQNLLTMMQS